MPRTTPTDQAPPTVTLSAPSGAEALIAGDLLRVAFTTNDDLDATVRVVLDRDGDVNTEPDQVLLYTATDQNGTPISVDLDTSLVSDARYHLFVVADDGVHAPVSSGGTRILVYPGLAGVSPLRANRYGVTGPYVVFSVGEAAQGNTILNGDGDTGDGVMSVLDTTDATRAQTGLSVDVTVSGLQSTARILPSGTGGIAWHLREMDQGIVLNGDGEMSDTVLGFVAPLLGVPPSIHTTGGATLTQAGIVGRRVVLLDETRHGSDLNGDLDAMDQLVAELDYATNTLPVVFKHQLRPGTPFVGSGGYGAYLADEWTQGALNGGAFVNSDGDTFDTLVVITDIPAGTIVAVSQGNVDPTAALATPHVMPGTPVASYYVDEFLASPTAPLNGDADSADYVSTLNRGADVFPGPPSPPLNAGVGARYAFAAGTRVIQLAGEEGLVDHNNDGDALDTEVLFWADAAALIPVWTPIPAGLGTLTGLTLDGGFAAMVAPGWLGLVVSESQNNVELGGPGPKTDSIFLLVDLSGPTVHNTGIVPLDPSTLVLPGATIPITGVGGDTGVVIQAAETANGFLNADADTTDTLLVYFDFTAPATPVFLPETGGLHAAVCGGRILVTAHESLTNTDFTDDGDTQDYVLRAFDTTGAVLERGLPCAQQSVPATDDGSVWAYLRDESTEARTLNPDADMADLVLGIWLP